MILIVGATGTLGGHVARQLLAKGHPVRAMTRDPARATALEAAGAEVVRGDLRDPASLRAAVRGVHAVVSASHSMLGVGKSSSARVDDEGQRALIAAAKDAGVGHFVFTSVIGASPNHPVDFWRTKERIEQHLKQSGLRYTIVRPSAFMEIYAYELIGKAVMAGKRVVLLGQGNSVRNMVAAVDVASCIVLALEDERWRGETIEVGGPQNVSGAQILAVFEAMAGTRAKVTRVPLSVLRVMASVAQTVHPGVGRILKAAIVAEMTDQTFDPTPLMARCPMTLTPLDEWARAHVGRSVGAPTASSLA